MTSLPSTPPSSQAQPAQVTLSRKSRYIALFCGLALIGATVGVMSWRVIEMMDHHLPLLAKMPLKESQTGRYLSARVAYNAGSLNNSLKYTLNALKDEPDNQRLQEHAYRTALFVGDYPTLVKYAAALPITAEPGLPPGFVLTMNAFQKGHFNDAENLLTGLPPKGFSAAFYSIMKQWAQVGTKTLQKPAQIPAFAVRSGELALLMTYHVALVNEQGGFADEAKVNYGVLQANASALPSRTAHGLINYLQRQGRAQDAQAVLAAHLSTHPDAPIALQPEGKIVPLVATVQDGMAELLYGMASLYSALQASAEATAHLRLALFLRPQFPVAYYMLGMLQEQSKHFDDAVVSYLTIKPGDALYRRAQLRTALLEYKQGNEKGSFKRLDALQKAEPKSYDALLARGDLLREQKQYRLAASTYTQALARISEPKVEHWHIFYARGIAYERAQDWAKAEADLRKALELNPDQPEVMNYLGYSWLVQGGDLQQARNMIAAALEQQPDNPAIIDSMGWALYLDGDYSQALAFLEQAADMMPKDATINDHLGDIYWRLGRLTEAKYQWERALLFKPDEPGQKEAIEKKLESGLPALSGEQKQSALAVSDATSDESEETDAAESEQQ